MLEQQQTIIFSNY